MRQYFEPVSDLAKVGGTVHRLFGEDFKDCADQILSNCDSIKTVIDSMPKEGWFVRTESCSPKVIILVS